MNREILFRGKRIDDEEWIYGMPARQPDGCLCEIEHLNYDRLTNGVPSIEYFEVDPKTVCQYTGFVDKYGNKIFEGDIVAYTDMTYAENGYVEMGCVGEVVWDEEELCFHVTERLSAESWEVLQECYVIGNIFDNPELLEVNSDE